MNDCKAKKETQGPSGNIINVYMYSTILSMATVLPICTTLVILHRQAHRAGWYHLYCQNPCHIDLCVTYINKVKDLKPIKL